MEAEGSVLPTSSHGDFAPIGASGAAAPLVPADDGRCPPRQSQCPPLPSRRRPSSWSRALVQRRLAALQRGTVTLTEGADSLRFGTPAADELSAEITVHHPRFYRALVWGGSLGAAESYLAGDWSSHDLVTTIRLMVRNRQTLLALDGWAQRLLRPAAWLDSWLRRNSRSGSRRNIAAHYDLGNEFFERLLDPTLTYSCGLFEDDAATMQDASLAKYERVCRKLQLQPHHHLLEIGSGWGGFAMYAAQHYGCRVTTVTISRAQFSLARDRVARAGLTPQVEVRLSDYRELSGCYDKIVSLEMVEAVGHRYLPGFFRRCSELLRPDGQMLLQAITILDQYYEAYRRSVDFIQKHIFPGGCLPSLRYMLQAVGQATDMFPVHFEDFASHYVRTLQHWRNSLRHHLRDVAQLGKEPAFFRAWNYYFGYCEAGFAERQIGVGQLLLSKPECRLEYVSGNAAPLLRGLP